MKITPEVEAKLNLLKEKYDTIGQDYSVYLDCLLHQDTVKYWITLILMLY